jgi:hypothetical protein
VRTLIGHTGWLLMAAWSPDERQLVTAGRDAVVRVRDAGIGHVGVEFAGLEAGQAGGLP